MLCAFGSAIVVRNGDRGCTIGVGSGCLSPLALLHRQCSLRDHMFVEGLEDFSRPCPGEMAFGEFMRIGAELLPQSWILDQSLDLGRDFPTRTGEELEHITAVAKFKADIRIRQDDRLAGCKVL